MNRTGIIDYGIGNLRSVQNAFLSVGEPAEPVSDPGALLNYNRLVLPGVGAFGKAMENLQRAGLAEALCEVIKANKKKLLGLCLGMQLLFEESEEGNAKGLGILKGKVLSLKRIAGGSRVPHVGWNNVRPESGINGTRLLQGINDPCFYFVHSYYCVPEQGIMKYLTDYGAEFVSAVETENIMACQFHPEKSHDGGLQVLKNFCAW